MQEVGTMLCSRLETDSQRLRRMPRTLTHTRLSAGLLLGAAVSACASNQTGAILDNTAVRPVSIINVGDRELDTLLFLGADVPIVGAALGSHHDGLMKVPQYTIHGTAELQRAYTEWMLDGGYEMLGEAGYPVRKPSRIFGALEDYSDVGLALAGEVTRLTLDTYGSLAGDKTEASLTVRWELLDVETRDVLYTRSTSSSAVTGGASGDAVRVAFQRLFGMLLADRRFVRALPERAVIVEPVSPPHRPSVPWRTPLPGPSEIIELSADQTGPSQAPSAFERVAAAVVTLVGPDRSGSAFLLTTGGLAVTNHHVVVNQDWLLAIDRANDTLDVRVVRFDEEADVALVQLRCPSQCATVVVSDESPEIGVDILVVGTPLSHQLSYSATRGILSGRRLSNGVTLLQTDAAVNPGNSGGPMVAPDGTVVGIVTSKLTGDEIEGLGFGVEIEDALRRLGVRKR